MPLTVSLDVPAHPSALARTGAGVDSLVALALLLLVMGAVLLHAARVVR
jgi:hypothetical protein